MNNLGYKSFFASIAITLFTSNSFAMNSADQGLENGAVIQQAVEVLSQDPETTKLMSELKNNSGDKTIIDRLIQRVKDVLNSSNGKIAVHRVIQTIIILGALKYLTFGNYYIGANFVTKCMTFAFVGLNEILKFCYYDAPLRYQIK